MSDIYYWKNLPASTAVPSAFPSRQNIFAAHEQLINKFFDDFFGNRKNFNLKDSSYPKMDIVETPDFISYNCAVPGVSEEDLDIETTKETRLLTIKGKSYIVYDSQHSVHLKELKLSAFTRTVAIPEHVDIEKCDAKLQDGILYLSFPILKKIEPEVKETIKKISLKK